MMADDEHSGNISEEASKNGDSEVSEIIPEANERQRKTVEVLTNSAVKLGVGCAGIVFILGLLGLALYNYNSPSIILGSTVFGAIIIYVLNPMIRGLFGAEARSDNPSQ